MDTRRTGETLLKKASSIKIIPTVSGVLQRALDIIEDPDSSFAELHNILKYDPALSIKFISIANCPYYSRGIEICTLRKAMETIGLDEVKRIVACVLHFNVVTGAAGLKKDDLLDFWRHSMFVACASRVIAGRMLVDDPEKAFTIGLLHDIGKIPFYDIVEDYRRVIEGAAYYGRDLSSFEEDLFAVTHGEIGWHIARKWGLPEEFWSPIRHHHKRSDGESGNDLLSVVKTADRFLVSSGIPLDAQGLILLKEKTAIENEIEKITALVLTPETR